MYIYLSLSFVISHLDFMYVVVRLLYMIAILYSINSYFRYGKVYPTWMNHFGSDFARPCNFKLNEKITFLCLICGLDICMPFMGLDAYRL